MKPDSRETHAEHTQKWIIRSLSTFANISGVNRPSNVTFYAVIAFSWNVGDNLECCHDVQTQSKNLFTQTK